MKQEDKELLFKDLCARLPYGVKVQHQDENYLEEVQTVEYISRQYGEIETNSVLGFADDFKPYLRPMPSITLEELEEFRRFGDHIRDDECKIHIANYEQIDWLNKNMFDYRGLIPKGLAIEVTEDNNPYKELKL